MTSRIITTCIYPPIPIRAMDWAAHYDGDEPNDDGQMTIGYGATEQDAIADLVENNPRDEEPMRLPPAPKLELHAVEVVHLDGRLIAWTLIEPFEQWGWIKQTVADEFGCSPDDVTTEDTEAGDVVMVRGAPVGFIR